MRHGERANAFVDVDFPSALSALSQAGIRFIVEYRPPRQALAQHNAYLRGAPPGLRFVMDAETLRKGLNFTLTTDLGPIDLLGEMLGGGTYEDIVSSAQQVSL